MPSRRSRRCASWTALLASTVVVAAGAARAQEEVPGPEPSMSRAEELFQEGKRLLVEGQTDLACQRLAESERADPSIGTLGLLASCHETQGKIATAWREYRTTADRAELAGDERARFARDRVAALEPRVPRLAVRVPESTPGLEISVGAERLPATGRGELLLDPGRYAVLARAPGRRPFEVALTLRDGDGVTIDVPVLEPAADASPRDARPPAPSSPLLPVAAALGAIGVAGIGVGTAFGLTALDKNRASETIHATCAAASRCAEGRALREDAERAATVATVSFAAAAAALGAGTVVLVTRLAAGDPAGPPARPGAPRVGVAPLGTHGAAGAVMGVF